eukprot:7391664-Prymnesium_polylepis.2
MSSPIVVSYGIGSAAALGEVTTRCVAIRSAASAPIATILSKSCRNCARKEDTVHPLVSPSQTCSGWYPASANLCTM